MQVVILQMIKSANVCVAASGAEEVCDILMDKLGDLVGKFTAEGWASPNWKQWALNNLVVIKDELTKFYF